MLQWVYASEGIANVFNSEAKLGQYLFQGCINLAEVALSELSSSRKSALQARVSELTPGCLSSTGITALALPMHFVTLGAHACDSCRLLKNIDLSNTQVEEIPEFATSLKEVLLPITLHTIRVKAFMNCAALVELAIPPSLRYIGSMSLVGLSRCQEGINGEESVQKKMLSPFVLHAMATLAAHDPEHGAHPWSWMKTRLLSCLQRALHSQTRVWARVLAWVQGRSTIMTGQSPEGSGETSQLYPCIGSSTQEYHGGAKGKQTKINCTLPKTSVPEQTEQLVWSRQC